MYSTLRLSILAFCLIILSSNVEADDAAAIDGSDLAWKYRCITCHGDRGKSDSARYPHIAGQNATYLELRLKYFRSYTEPGNQMNAQAVPLSDGEIRILAEHFSRMPR